MPDVAPSLTEYIVAHMVRAVASTPALAEPFPHFSVTGFFPSDVYEELLSLLPEPAMYDTVAYDATVAADQATNRRRFSLLSKSLHRLATRQETFWLTVRSALGSELLKRTVYEKLRNGLAFRYGCRPAEAAQLPGFALPDLYHETQGYTIKPHPDTRRKVVTMQVALPRDNSQSHLGTEFYERSFSPASFLRDPKGFNIVKTLPFTPNTASAFVVLNTLRLRSWHGRSKLGGDCGVRNSILNIWYASADDANPEIVAENRATTPALQAA